MKSGRGCLTFHLLRANHPTPREASHPRSLDRGALGRRRDRTTCRDADRSSCRVSFGEPLENSGRCGGPSTNVNRPTATVVSPIASSVMARQ
jgi:hypothetical protein